MPRWEPNARLRLVEAALDLFEENGYDATGVIDIAERAGLTKTTFFRHFPDKREVLFAGQEAHSELLAEAIVAAPDDATPLQMVEAALHALTATQPPEQRAFNVRWRAVIDAHSELQEREALKHEGYLAAMAEALKKRSVEPTTATVAADLGMLAFRIAYGRWTRGAPGSSLSELLNTALEEIRLASSSLS